MFLFLKKFREKQIFSSMFIAVSGLAIMCVLLACVSGFIWFRSSRIEEEKQKDINVLYASSLTLNNYIQTAEYVMKTLQNDAYVKRMVAKNYFAWDDETSIAAKSIVNTVTVNSMFHSIYIISNEEYLIKCSSSAYPLDINGDTKFINLFYQMEFGHYAPYYYTDIYGEQQSLLCLADGELDHASGQNEDGILISIDIGKVMEQLFSNRRDGEQYLLTDLSGNIIYSCGGMYANTDSVEQELLTEINKKGQNQQSALINLNGDRFLFTSIGVGDQFLLMHLLPDIYMMESVKYIGRIFILIAILMICLVAIIAFGMSNLVYQPIDMVVRTTESFLRTSDKNENDERWIDRLQKTELANLAQAYVSVVETLNDISLQKDWEKLAHYLSARSGREKLPEWVEETYGKEGIHLRVMCIRHGDIIKINGNSTEEAIRFELKAITTIIEQVLHPLGDVIANSVNQDYIAVLLFTVREISEEEIKDRGKEIIRITKELLTINMEIGISGQCDSFSELASMYQIARAATAYRFMYGINAVVTESEMENLALNHMEQVNLEPILKEMRESNREGFIREYTALVEMLKLHSIQTAKDQLFLLAVEMQKFENSLQYHSDQISSSGYEHLNNELSAFEYIDDVKQYFLDKADQIWMILIRARQNNKEDIVERAVTFLEEHYADVNISAQYIADMYHISPSYFSRLFNEKKGCAFPDYLTTIRIEKARLLLLKENNLSIQDICNLVGYSSASYFTASFKKKYGLTPGQFRKNYRESEQN